MKRISESKFKQQVREGLADRAEQWHLPLEQRPMCQHPGCTSRGIIHNWDWRDGRPRYRKWCNQHHNERTAARHGLKTISEITAQRNGYTSVADYVNSQHPYRQYRKDHCENLDARLGFTCTSTILIAAQLEVDHINGNPGDNRPENLQTLCCCCHKYKTIVSGDRATPGRKTVAKKQRRLHPVLAVEDNCEAEPQIFLDV